MYTKKDLACVNTFLGFVNPFYLNEDYSHITRGTGIYRVILPCGIKLQFFYDVTSFPYDSRSNFYIVVNDEYSDLDFVKNLAKKIHFDLTF